MEIPDAERDAGKEILYQVTQQAFNELLDTLFKKKEDLAVRAAETKEQREKYRQYLDSFELDDEDEKPTKESPKPPVSRSRPPISRPIQQQSLQELLFTSGYTVTSPDATNEQPSQEVTDRHIREIHQELPIEEAGSPQMAASPANNLIPTVHRDPTMPQFMPNSALQSPNCISSQMPHSNPPQGGFSLKHEASDASTISRGMLPNSASHIALTAQPDTSDTSDQSNHVPRSTFAAWKLLDLAEQEARDRGGWGRLSYAEFEEIYREHEFQEGSKNRLAYLGSWIDFCIPS
jgi:hypothetical protein